MGRTYLGYPRNVRLDETSDSGGRTRSSTASKFCDSDGSGAVHNLAAGRAGAKLELGTDVKGVEDLLEARDHTLTRKGVLDVELGPYGYLWLKLQR